MDKTASDVGVKRGSNHDEDSSPSNIHNLDSDSRWPLLGQDSPYPAPFATTGVRKDSFVGSDQRQVVYEKDMSASNTLNFKNNPHPTQNANTILVNPLVGIPHDKLEEMAVAFAQSHGLSEDTGIICKGALVAKDPFAFDSLPQLSEDEKSELLLMCSLAATVHGMADSIGIIAISFWAEQSQDASAFIISLVTIAPYLSSAIVGSWLTGPVNRRLGRRRTVFLTAMLSLLTSAWQAATNSWAFLLVTRVILGLNLGLTSSTVPMYAAECAPTPIRGALVMMWQAWVAFGSMLGYAITLAMYYVNEGLRWHLMFASISVPAILVMAQLIFYPETAAVHFAAAVVYFFAIFYSCGEGAVSYTYPAEAFPMDVRETGMAFASATGATFNFLLALAIPFMIFPFTPFGMCMWFMAWNVVGWVLTFLFVPETMGRSLEELDLVFSVPTRRHALYQLREVSVWFNRHIRRKDVEPQPELYSYSGLKTYLPLDVEHLIEAASSDADRLIEAVR
ncbi:MFS general substrate transporter [Ceratobasidium sp. AG-I]|nr:MFS general substrate transporter [Ceratobasidium sp. AG-I]